MGRDVILNKIEAIERCINLKVVQTIIEKHLKDFQEYIYQINKLL